MRWSGELSISNIQTAFEEFSDVKKTPAFSFETFSMLFFWNALQKTVFLFSRANNVPYACTQFDLGRKSEFMTRTNGTYNIYRHERDFSFYTVPREIAGECIVIAVIVEKINEIVKTSSTVYIRISRCATLTGRRRSGRQRVNVYNIQSSSSPPPSSSSGQKISFLISLLLRRKKKNKKKI